jgi:hypothetical protein
MQHKASTPRSKFPGVFGGPAPYIMDVPPEKEEEKQHLIMKSRRDLI